MTALKKRIFLFLFVVGILENYSLFTVYQPKNLQSYNFIRLEDYEYIGLWTPCILFYISVFYMIFLLFCFIILLFIPVKEKVLLNKCKNTKTVIEMKAIKSLVLLELNEIDYIENNKVKILIFKNKKKIKGSITGSVIPYYDLNLNSEELLNRITSSISTMFGIPENAIQFKLCLKSMKANKKRKNARVK